MNENECIKSDFVCVKRKRGLVERIKNVLIVLASLPKTIYFNFRALPFSQAILFPILIKYDTEIIEIHKNIVKFLATPYPLMVKIGFSGSAGIVQRKQSICFETGQVFFGNHNVFSEGISLRNSGIIIFGDEFYCNKNCTIWANEKISFGNNITCGWEITIRDCDGHLILKNGVASSVQKEIRFGKHVWLCSETDVLKGAGCGDNCVIGYKSLLTKYYCQSNVLIAGHPAKIIDYNIDWVHG